LRVKGDVVRQCLKVSAQVIEKSFKQGVPMVVVGTKLDLFNEKEVDSERIRKLSNDWGVPFHKTSAKRGWHVTEVFEDLLRQMRRHYPTDPLKNGGT
jgi:putative ribosome biogenesis GTPase RsgA